MYFLYNVSLVKVPHGSTYVQVESVYVQTVQDRKYLCLYLTRRKVSVSRPFRKKNLRSCLSCVDKPVVRWCSYLTYGAFMFGLDILSSVWDLNCVIISFNSTAILSMFQSLLLPGLLSDSEPLYQRDCCLPRGSSGCGCSQSLVHSSSQRQLEKDQLRWPQCTKLVSDAEQVLIRIEECMPRPKYLRNVLSRPNRPKLSLARRKAQPKFFQTIGVGRTRPPYSRPKTVWPIPVLGRGLHPGLWL